MTPRIWFRCTHSGAVSPSKNSLSFAQNLENKGPEFFLPPRSMVLKVLAGKILETLKLWCTGTRLRLHFGNRGEAIFFPHFSQPQCLKLPRRCAHVSLSKIDYYLLDNYNGCILSQTKGLVNEKRGGDASGSKLGISGPGF